MRRPISDQIKISDMRAMHETGMTYQQIADALGICATTVCRYIGKPGSRKRRVLNDNPITPEFPIASKLPLVTEPKVSVQFIILSEVKTFKGIDYTYVVDEMNKKVEISEHSMSFDADKLDTFIEELKVIRGKLT